jgi:hypothetical protein
VFQLLANQRATFQDDFAAEWGALECLQLQNGSLLALYRDGHWELFDEPPAPHLEIVRSNQASGSLMTTLALPSDFPRGVEATLEQLWAELGTPGDSALPTLLAKLDKLARGRYQLALVLTYGELLRRQVGGAWLGVAHHDGIEPALVSASHGLLHFAGPLLKFATRAWLPPLAHFAGSEPAPTAEQ